MYSRSSNKYLIEENKRLQQQWLARENMRLQQKSDQKKINALQSQLADLHGELISAQKIIVEQEEILGLKEHEIEYLRQTVKELTVDNAFLRAEAWFNHGDMETIEQEAMALPCEPAQALEALAQWDKLVAKHPSTSSFEITSEPQTLSLSTK